MATEKRLIDANALETHFRTTKIIEVFPYWSDLPFATQCELVKYGKKCKEIILSAPTVDAVEVVRCKDCKHGMKSHLQPPYEKRKYLCRHSWEGGYHKPDHFCSYGERRTDG